MFGPAVGESVAAKIPSETIKSDKVANFPNTGRKNQKRQLQHLG